MLPAAVPLPLAAGLWPAIPAWIGQGRVERAAPERVQAGTVLVLAARSPARPPGGILAAPRSGCAPGALGRRVAIRANPFPVREAALHVNWMGLPSYRLAWSGLLAKPQVDGKLVFQPLQTASLAAARRARQARAGSPARAQAVAAALLPPEAPHSARRDGPLRLCYTGASRELAFSSVWAVQPLSAWAPDCAARKSRPARRVG